MKKSIWILAIVVMAGVLGLLMLRQKRVLPPSGMGEIIVPCLISDEAWRVSIAADPTAHGYSGYGILQDRGSDAAIREGLRDLNSDDAYVWMNAALYLGSCGRLEAVPYLIKTLRHTAWRSDGERVELLEKLTNQSFVNDFDLWREWCESQSKVIEMDWTSSLGGSPRLQTTKRGVGGPNP